MNKILLVGELNPYGADPAFALYPLPAHASGNRLKEILGLSMGDYLKKHDRVNLCTGEFTRLAAEEAALAIHGARPEGTGVVLCGVKVADAFRRAAAYTKAEFQPLSLAEHHGRWYLCLPHPSGLNRMWNVPEVAVTARVQYDKLCERVGLELSLQSRPR